MARRNWDDMRELIEEVRTLLPALAERAPAANAAGALPPETIADLKRLGVLRLLQPKRFGGLEGPFATFSEIAEALSSGCASTGWVYGVLAEHSWIVACFPERAQQEVWGEDPLAVASSSLAPRAVARRVPGGWRLSGRYPFSSGCLHAQWAIAGAFCEEADGSVHQLVSQAMARLCDIAGTQWVYDDNPLQLMMRDVQTTAMHGAVNWQVGMVPYGRMRLGLAPDG